MNARMTGCTENIALRHSVLRPDGVLLIKGSHIAQNAFKVYKQIGPEAFGALGGAGGMGDMARNDGDIALDKGKHFTLEGQGSALAMAKTDFQAIVKMQPIAQFVGNMPLIPLQYNHGEIERQIIYTILDNGLS